MKKDIIKESIADAKAIKDVSERRASQLFAREFKAPLKTLLADVINEQVSAGSDQPSGYSPTEDQDKIAGGQDINTGGDGPEKIQEEEEITVDDEVTDEEPVMEGEEDFSVEGEDEEPVMEGDDMEFSDDDEEMYEGDGLGDSDDENIGGEEDQVIEIVDDNAVEDEEPVMEAELGMEDDEEELAEQKKYKKIAIKLAKENKQLRGAIKTLNEGFNKLNLFNAKLAHAFQFMRQPGLTRNERKQIANSFDRVKTIREVKLVADTIRKTLGKTVKPKSLKEAITTNVVKSSASKMTALNEQASNRLKELAFGVDFDNEQN